MGQVCSGAKEESPRAGLLDVSPGDADDEELVATETSANNNGDVSQQDGGGIGQQQQPSEGHDEQTAASAALADMERRKRRELWIVNGAARGMVAVRSTRGSTGYYDQGFAGLLAQHLEQTTSFPDKLPLVLPLVAPLKPSEGENTGANNSNTNSNNNNNSPEKAPASKQTSTLYDRLAQHKWDGMEVVVHDDDSKLRGREASAAASGDPHKLMDALAESLLDGPYTVLPAKQQLFAGAKPMVENLL